MVMAVTEPSIWSGSELPWVSVTGAAPSRGAVDLEFVSFGELQGHVRRGDGLRRLGTGS